MARRRAPQPPPLDAQRKAAAWPKDGKRWAGIQITDTEQFSNDVDRLEGWLLRYHPAAAEIAPRGRGAPVKWTQMVEALRWLRARGLLKISDAPGGRCAKELGRFLDHTRARRIHGSRDSTAEELVPRHSDFDSLVVSG